jgi:GT2 family glycosyltransferase
VWPSVTVTVLAFRSGDTSSACVASVLAGDYPGPVDVLVREQGGDDAELAALEALAASDDRVRVERGDNLGFCGGHNRLLGQAQGALVLLLNADARLEPGFLRAAVPAFDDASVGAVQGLVLLDGAAERTVDTTGLVPSRSRRIVARDHGQTWVDQRPAEEVWGVDGAVALYRAAALVDAAGPGGEVLVEAFFAYKEDVELAWRLRRLGWTARFEPNAVAWHRRGSKEPDAGSVRAQIAARRARSAMADVHGFANLRLTQLRHEQVADLRRDLLPWLRRELGAWAVTAATPARLVAAVVRILRGIGPARRARRQLEPRIRVRDDARWFT